MIYFKVLDKQEQINPKEGDKKKQFHQDRYTPHSNKIIFDSLEK